MFNISLTMKRTPAIPSAHALKMVVSDFTRWGMATGAYLNGMARYAAIINPSHMMVKMDSFDSDGIVGYFVSSTANTMAANRNPTPHAILPAIVRALRTALGYDACKIERCFIVIIPIPTHIVARYAAHPHNNAQTIFNPSHGGKTVMFDKKTDICFFLHKFYLILFFKFSHITGHKIKNRRYFIFIMECFSR